MKRKLIEVALPLDAINKASAREESIRHGHPSTLHLWWARRPLAAARAVIFAQMVAASVVERQCSTTEYERQYPDGSDPSLLDIMDVPLLDPRPKGYQQENWLLDPDRYWEKAGRAAWDDPGRLADPDASLWIDGHHTYNGRSDKIPLALAEDLRSSLRLVRVERLALSVFKPGEAFGNPKRRVQGRFRHHKMDYGLWVTDPTYERAYLARPDGDYEIGECFLTVSLGEPHEGACYKLIAAVIERERGSRA
jgi:hypothetical protein